MMLVQVIREILFWKKLAMVNKGSV